MRRPMLSVCISLVSLAAAVTSAAAESATLPTRKAGLWELKTSMDEGGGPRDQTMKLCIDADMERSTAAASLTDHKEKCTRYDIKKDGDAVVIEGECTYDIRKVSSTTRMTGDFKSAFDVKIESVTSGSETNRDQTTSVKRTITQKGTYLAESCGDLKAGEAEGSDGARFLVQ